MTPRPAIQNSPCEPVRAENPVHGSDQESCASRRPAVMITVHVPAVRLPPDHADGLMAGGCRGVSRRGRPQRS